MGVSSLLGQPAFDCRRGSCLTCAARLAPSSSRVYGEFDASALDANAKLKGFILLCNSFPIDEELVVETDSDGDVQDEMWKLQYNSKFVDGATKKAGRIAAAKTITRLWENEPEEYIRRQEKKFKPP